MPVNQESAVQRHDRMMREEREQAERLRTDQGVQPDIWKGKAAAFSVPEAESPVVGVLAKMVDADDHVIDIGAGGGRITIPLARRVREMIAVEPSAAMREVLAREIDERNIRNLRVIPEMWEAVIVQPAELVFAAHVTYSVPDIEPFLRKLDATATRVAALVAFTNPAQHVLAPFWKHVYGEERLRLPCRDELLDVMRELGAEPHVIPAETMTSRAFGPADQAFDHLRGRLFIGEGTVQEARLRDAIKDLTVERNGEMWPIAERQNEQSVMWWEPGHFHKV